MSALRADFLLVHASPLVTCEPRNGDPLGAIADGAVAAHEGRIVAVGTTAEVTAALSATPDAFVDATGHVVTPGLVDAHTHLLFAGSREHEFVQRLQGASYQDIAAAGGGILSTVARVRAADREQLVSAALPRLRRMLLHGTTTAEAKSGYGLTTADELKMLEAIAALDVSQAVDLVPTFLGAHEVPPEFRSNPDGYVDLVVEEMTPAVARARLAKFCDVFCEEGVFTPEQSRRVLEAGAAAGLCPKIHADEFARTGGAALAAELHAVSADHLIQSNAADFAALCAAGVTPLLCPGTPFTLRLPKFADARGMLAAGLPVALGTDCNPGTSMNESLPLVMSLACILMRMTPAEALLGATRHAARAVGRSDDIGSLAAGKRADLVAFDAPSVDYLPYHYGANLVRHVVKDGRVVVADGRLTAAGEGGTG